METTTYSTECSRQAQNPLTELRMSLADFAARCRTMRWFGALFRVGVAQDIVADVAQSEAVASQRAYSAEQCDREAEKEIVAAREELERALKGGLDGSDVNTVVHALQRLKRARKLTRLSADDDRRVSEQLSVA